MLAHFKLCQRFCRRFLLSGHCLWSSLIVHGFATSSSWGLPTCMQQQQTTTTSPLFLVVERRRISSRIQPQLRTSSTSFDTSSTDSWESEDLDDFALSELDTDTDDLELRNDTDQEGEKDEEGLESINDSLFTEYDLWKVALKKCVSSLDKKQASLQSELRKAESVEETVQRAELITSNMYLLTPGVRTATVNDWNHDGVEVELTLDDAYDSASAEADALFQQARKLKRGSQIVRSLLEDTSRSQQILKEIQTDFDAALSADGAVNENVLRLLQRRMVQSSKKTGFREPSQSEANQSTKPSQHNQQKGKPGVGTPASNLRKFLSPGGCVVIVGRNRRGNEYLTFNIARGDDIWMHARGCPGAHVVIQQRRGSPPATDACIKFAADLAVFYSDARSEASFEVTTSEPKHLLKPRGAPLGAVKLRQESGTVVGRPDDVPEECKVARDASGQDTEYRFQDKAKHRKRTREAAKKQRDKKRASKK